MNKRALPRIAAIMMVFAVSAFGHHFITAQTPPKIVINETSHSLGEIKKDSLAVYDFTFKNEGQSELQIKNVSPACGCTASEFTKSVAPGEQGKITLSINTAGYSNAITKTAEVYTNDPQNDHFTLSLSFVVASTEKPQGKQVGPFVVGPSDRITPSNNRSLNVPQGMIASGIIIVTNTSPQLIHLTKAVSSSDALTATLQTLEEGKRYLVSYASKDNLPLGLNRQSIKLLTDSKEMPDLEIKVEVDVVIPVTVKPQSVIFENVPVSDPEMLLDSSSKFLWVEMNRGTGLELTSVTSDLPYLKIKNEPTESGGQLILLRVGFSEKPPKGTHAGKITIKTNNANSRVIEVPVVVNAN